MTFELPDLPYARDALAPTISEETLDFHYGKHHAAYVTNLNELVDGRGDPGKRLEDLVKSASGGVFDNAAQVWNHTFYWNSMTPNGSGAPSGDLAARIDGAFGSLAALKEKFVASAAGNFGSGWTWLVAGRDGKLAVVNTSDADTPITDGLAPLLACDVWEHAYYIDYRNARPKYLDAWWEIANWEFAATNL